MNISKVPCLAIIKQSPDTPENVGLIVQVLRKAIPGELIARHTVSDLPNQWIVESVGSRLVWPNANDVKDRPLVKVRSYVDFCLCEIKGDEEKEGTETDEPIEEKA